MEQDIYMDSIWNSSWKSMAKAYKNHACLVIVAEEQWRGKVLKILEYILAYISGQMHENQSPGDMGWHTRHWASFHMAFRAFCGDTLSSLLRVSTTDSCFHTHWLPPCPSPLLAPPPPAFPETCSVIREIPSLRLSTSKYFCVPHNQFFWLLPPRQTPKPHPCLYICHDLQIPGCAKDLAGCFDLGSPWMSRIPTRQNKQVFSFEVP